MKKICLLICACCALLAGCLWDSTSTAPRIFDLDNQESKHTLPCQLRFSIIRNISGSDRRFLERRAGGRIRYDEFNRWNQDPELMLERFLRNRIHGNGDMTVHVRSVITAFEIDAVNRETELAVDFTLSCGDRKKSVTCSARQKFSEDSGSRSSAIAEAMSKCAASVAVQLEKNILEIIKPFPVK